ncbi:C5a anaphylatoxin chemotactic receptor 1 [Dissostichus eleginoides]|uniref:C5a anaphylatoxin chemotactic receptor 1 n=1 Tax=Dissostichus eleginoides TaxID=100907 RepID=A0AAD9FF11_DISEL|nr:C5a anaphylatoxin chemotactic receptor 1 [Dissostichus eleginoides]KAK1900247.1 C5a anaphylatoxin chemotactic receptor 1 [Dissostichus eleginoides]
MASPFEDYESISNFSDSYEFNYTLPVFPDTLTPEMQPIQIASLVFYGLVVLLGVPGNAVVVWVTGFCMPHSVTSLWFLNLALADLLCCLSLPLLMVPLAHDDHWHFGSLACTLVKGLFYLVMHCSVLQLVLISVDRWMLVSRPVWCQNKRRPKQAALGCVAVWVLALIGSIPHARLVISYRFLVGFLLPFLVIVACHLVVYSRAESVVSRGRTRSKRTLRVIVVVVLSFFLCWLPLHIVDFMVLLTPRNSPHSPKLYLAQLPQPAALRVSGSGFKDSMNRSLRNMLPFISEEPASRVSITNNDTKCSSYANDTTKI